MKQKRNFLFLDQYSKPQDLVIEIDDADSIDKVKDTLKKKLGLTDDYVIEFLKVPGDRKNEPFNSVCVGLTSLVIRPAKIAVKLEPVQAVSGVKIEPVATVSPPSSDIKIEPQPEVQADVWSYKNSRNDDSPYQDTHFTFAVDLIRPVGLRDDFAEQAVNKALQTTFEELSKTIDKLAASENSGATLTVCAAAKLNVGVDSQEIKGSNVPVTIVTAQLGDSAAHLITAHRAKLLAPIHRTTNQREKTRVNAAVAELNNPRLAMGEKMRSRDDEEKQVANNFSETSPTRTLGRADNRYDFALLDKPEISIIHLSAKQANLSEVCLTTDGVWESVPLQHLADYSPTQLCGQAAQNTEDDLTAVKVSLAQVSVGKMTITGIGDGNGDNGHVVVQHIANNFAAKFTKNLNTSLDVANKAQREFKLAGKVLNPKVVINNFIIELDEVLRECDKRLGQDHNHQGLQVIKDSLVKIKANQNNPWAQLEKLGKEISQRSHGFWGSLKKYARDPLVQAMYSNLTQLFEKNCNGADNLIDNRLKLLANLTQRLQSDLGRVKQIEFSENPFVFRR